MTILPPRLRVPVLTAGLLVVLGYCGLQLQALTFPVTVGLDFPPVRNAGVALLHGRSIYADHDFVYPPVAALLGAPFGLAGVATAFTMWLLLSAVALAGVVRLIVRAAPPEPTTRVVLGGVALMLFGGGCVATDSLWLGNASVLLVPVAVAAVLAFSRDKWGWGCALLVGSLLIKPMLVGLLLVPLLRGRWRPLVGALAAGTAVLGAATVLLPGGHDFVHVLVYCVRGTNLHGQNAVNNLSLRGFVEYHHLNPLAGALASGLVLAGAGWLGQRHGAGWDVPRLSAVVFGVTLLAGAISEVHYLLTLGALVLTGLARRPTPDAIARVAPGLALLLAPVGLRDASGLGRQSWFLLAELLITAGLLSFELVPARAPRAVPVPA